MKRLLHILLVLCVLLFAAHCTKEKEVETVSDALDYIDAEVTVEQTDTAAVYHFVKLYADQTESRTKLRTLLAALNRISDTERPLESWDSISTYHYEWDEFQLYFTLKGPSLKGYIVVFPEKRSSTGK
ncbi:MAG: hypothetical protein IJL64_06570 [Bacteroidales bacterium]|nr:hypothetical protein [Bacteroidales bacterium]